MKREMDLIRDILFALEANPDLNGRSLRRGPANRFFDREGISDDDVASENLGEDQDWEKTKKGAEAAGGFTMDLLKDLAKGFIKKQIEERTGVKL